MDCFIHAGTHKTGTKTLQAFLREDYAKPLRGTLYVPRCGSFLDYPGHHNVAFELNDDPRFDHAGGRLSYVVGELRAMRPRSACVSSETFSLLYRRPDRLAALRDAFAAFGTPPRVVLYLREQTDFAESLYAELVKHGQTTTFTAFVNEIVATGAFRHDAHETYIFRYSELLDAFAGVFGAENLIVRAYHETPREWIVEDFLANLGVATYVTLAEALPPPGPEVNERKGFHAVARSRLGNLARVRELTADERARLSALPAEDAPDPRFAPLDDADARRIAEHFAADNALVAARWGVQVDAVRERRPGALPASAEAVRRALWSPERLCA
ncbi:MAG: hypothetical protein JO103_16050 [Candidatus Eremiobacteraeota bacterium]|nr:hypothetical protein [Candidatus Eremiobacteraeota bacterium]